MTYIPGLYRSMDSSKKEQRTKAAIREVQNRYEQSLKERELNIYGEDVQLGIDKRHEIG